MLATAMSDLSKEYIRLCMIIDSISENMPPEEFKKVEAVFHKKVDAYNASVDANGKS